MSWLWLLLATAVINLVLAELFDWFHRFAELLVRRAARLLPKSDQQRWEREWLAELDALPGKHLSHLLWSGGVWLGALRLGRALRQQPSLAGRGLDISMSAALLLLVLPLMATIAAALRAESPGPVLYRQTATNRHGTTFEALRFRTERAIGERRRESSVSQLVRSRSLDHLPLLVNVLRGDLSVMDLLRRWT